MELNLSVLDQYDLKTCNIDFQIFNEEDFFQVVRYYKSKVNNDRKITVFHSTKIKWFSIYNGALCSISKYNSWYSDGFQGTSNSIFIDLYQPKPLIKKINLKKVWI